MIISILFVAFCAGLALVVGRKVWGKPKEDDDVVWGSAFAPLVLELTSSPAWRWSSGARSGVAVRHVEHRGATEDAPAMGAIGTLATTTSADLLTFEQQVRGVDDWSGFDQAFIDYENAMLTRRAWTYTGMALVEHIDPVGLRFADPATARESTQQRIDRWLSEGGDGIRAARSEARQAVSETWDAPSRELPVLDSYVADRMAEAMLQA